MPDAASTSATDSGASAVGPRALLRDFLVLYPFQPATALWRAFEIDAVLRSPLPRGRGLDLGCGDGKLTGLIANRTGGWQLVGLDPDPSEIALAEASGVYERLHCAPGDHIPEPDATFDFVFSNSVLEHIPDVVPVLRESARVLRPGGELVFTVPSSELHDCLAGPPATWRLLFGSDRASYLSEFDRRIAHAYYWSDTRWGQELRAAGYSRVEVTPCFEEAAVRRFETVANLTSGLLFKLGGGGRRPIEIQRRLGMRTARRSPRALAAALAAALGAGLPERPGEGGRHGARLIRAWK